MIYVVGIGPGDGRLRTAEATEALKRCDVLVGYHAYLQLICPEFPHKEALGTGMTAEVERCRAAIDLSRAGKTVCVVCSGDAAVYGMASLILELAEERDEVEIVPGVTAALAASALLGAPLSGDLAIISLSDLLTPWAVIERRLEAAALGDFCIALYNPSSKKRGDYLSRAARIILRHQRRDIPCGLVKNIGRAGQRLKITTLGALSEEEADMFTTVIVGCSTTLVKGGRLITLRGYRK